MPKKKQCFTSPHLKTCVMIRWTDYLTPLIIQKKGTSDLIIPTHTLSLKKIKIRLLAISSSWFKAWICSKNISWIMAKWFKSIKIRFIIIFLFIMEHFFGDDISDGHLHTNVAQYFVKRGKNWHYSKRYIKCYRFTKKYSWAIFHIKTYWNCHVKLSLWNYFT